MKTKLIINDDLKRYLFKEIDRSTKESEELSKIFKRENFDWQWFFKFSDKYGASVIKSCCGSYGFDSDLFELAVIGFNEKGYFITGIEGIGDNPIGHLSNDEVMELLYAIKKFVELKGEENNEN